MTAEELLEKYQKDFNEKGIVYNLSKPMIEFAKYHVEKALSAAYENIEYTEENSSVPYVIEESILNAYPLKNII